MSAARSPRARTTRRTALVVAILGAIGSMLAFACTPDTAPIAAGGECFTATDCDPGLVCIPDKSGARQCSDDLTQVVGKPPPEAGPMEAGEAGEGGEAGPQPDGGQDTSIPDTSMPDTSKPPVDAAEAG